MTLASLAAFSGCTKNQVGCAVQDSVVTVLTPVIANGLQCTNAAAITESLKAAGTKAGLCVQATGQQSFPGSACTMLSGMLISSLANQAIPAAWGCSAANAQVSLNTLVNQACAKL